MLLSELIKKANEAMAETGDAEVFRVDPDTGDANPVEGLEWDASDQDYAILDDSY